MLGWPAWASIGSRRNFEAVETLQSQDGHDARSAAALDRLGRKAVAPQLGDSRGARWTNIVGFSLLALSFVFLGLASVERRHERYMDAAYRQTLEQRLGLR